MKTVAILIVLIAAVAVAGCGDSPTGNPPEDHLEPVSSTLDGGYDNHEHAAIVRDALKEAFASDVRLRMLTFAPFTGRENAVGLRQRSGRSYVFALRPQGWLWHYTKVGQEQVKRLNLNADGSIPADYRTVEIKRCELEIPSSIAGRVTTNWKALLLQTRFYEHPPRAVDASTFHFSMNLQDVDLAGQSIAIESPTVEAAINVARIMDEACMKNDPSAFSRLEKSLDVLEAHLAGKKELR